jgi:threonine/homoserine/homoserine lactone efflux protein
LHQEFLRNVIIGFLVAAPVGPIGLLCIHRTLRHGWLAGVCAGLGAATADSLCGLIAGTGIKAIEVFLRHNLYWMQLIGSLIIFFIGMHIYRKKPIIRECPTVHGYLFAYGSTLALTLATPATILAFIAIFFTFHIFHSSGMHGILLLWTGIFTGSSLWWLTLITTIGLFHRDLTDRQQTLINHIFGILLIVCAVLLLGETILKLCHVPLPYVTGQISHLHHQQHYSHGIWWNRSR